MGLCVGKDLEHCNLVLGCAYMTVQAWGTGQCSMCHVWRCIICH